MPPVIKAQYAAARFMVSQTNGHVLEAMFKMEKANSIDDEIKDAEREGSIKMKKDPSNAPLGSIVTVKEPGKKNWSGTVIAETQGGDGRILFVMARSGIQRRVQIRHVTTWKWPSKHNWLTVTLMTIAISISAAGLLATLKLLPTF